MELVMDAASGHFNTRILLLPRQANLICSQPTGSKMHAYGANKFYLVCARCFMAPGESIKGHCSEFSVSSNSALYFPVHVVPSMCTKDFS